MAKSAFQHLDEEAKALHDSWDHIGRLVLVVTLVAAVVWGACTALRLVVHETSHLVLEHAQEGLAGGAILLFVLAVAGIVRGLLLRNDPAWKDAAGDGMNVALENYHVTYVHDGDDPQPRYSRPAFALAARKALFTVLTLGSGGSGGLEAPTVLTAEALSSGIARVMQVRSEHELRTYQLAGIAAAVSTLLGAPFTAALFATEIAYGDRIIYRKLAYALWAGVVAYILSNRLNGYVPLFPAPEHGATYAIEEYAATTLVAVAVSAPAAMAFGLAMANASKVAERVPPVFQGGATAVAAGLVALALWWGLGIEPHHVLGMGEATMHDLLSGEGHLSMWWVLLALMGGKLATTALTLSGGGSAGLLVPSMYIGAVSGALVAGILDVTGVMPDLDPALFAVVGLASSLVAVIGVPLAA
ncbi:MAG: chloride channel protein, partial [Myxococcales bacterium]|nr:chloride channel protein [Myxococcales bacterium]